MMVEHCASGHRYPQVKINTAYSFGLDDQEFVVAFESDEPAAFLDLVMELRESQASRYTERETPIFTCVLMAPADALQLALGLAGEAHELQRQVSLIAGGWGRSRQARSAGRRPVGWRLPWWEPRARRPRSSGRRGSFARQ